MRTNFTLLDTPRKIIDRPGATTLVVKQGQVDYENVGFAYEKDAIAALDGISAWQGQLRLLAEWCW